MRETTSLLLPSSALARLSPSSSLEIAALLGLAEWSGPAQERPGLEDEDLYVSLDLPQIR